MNSATLAILEKTKKFIMEQETNTAYRTDPRRFSRTKKLSFKATVVLVLQKLHKSLTLELTHFFEKLSCHSATLTQSVSKSGRRAVPLYNVVRVSRLPSFKICFIFSMSNINIIQK